MVPSAIHLPKVDSTDILDEFTYAFNSATSDWLTQSSKIRVGLIIFIESSKGLIDLKEICQKAVSLKEKSAILPEAIVFGRLVHIFYYLSDVTHIKTNLFSLHTPPRQSEISEKN